MRFDRIFAINNTSYDKKVADALFAFDTVTVVEENLSIFNILVLCGRYPSVPAAKRGWTLSTDIPIGYSDWHNLGRDKSRLTIWNPHPDAEIPDLYNLGPEIEYWPY